jgi:hypothetical protein
VIFGEVQMDNNNINLSNDSNDNNNNNGNIFKDRNIDINTFHGYFVDRFSIAILMNAIFLFVTVNPRNIEVR